MQYTSPTNGVAKALIESTPRGIILEGHEMVKDLATKERAALRHLIQLYKLYRGDDQSLQSKEAKISMQALLTIAQKSYPEDVLQYGRVTWEPDPIAWMGFFDQIGDQTLAQFLNIGSPDQIPDPAAGDVGEVRTDAAVEGEDATTDETGLDMNDEFGLDEPEGDDAGLEASLENQA